MKCQLSRSGLSNGNTAGLGLVVERRQEPVRGRGHPGPQPIDEPARRQGEADDPAVARARLGDPSHGSFSSLARTRSDPGAHPNAPEGRGQRGDDRRIRLAVQFLGKGETRQASGNQSMFGAKGPAEIQTHFMGGRAGLLRQIDTIFNSGMRRAPARRRAAASIRFRRRGGCRAVGRGAGGSARADGAGGLPPAPPRPGRRPGRLPGDVPRPRPQGGAGRPTGAARVVALRGRVADGDEGEGRHREASQARAGPGVIRRRGPPPRRRCGDPRGAPRGDRPAPGEVPCPGHPLPPGRDDPGAGPQPTSDAPRAPSASA